MATNRLHQQMSTLNMAITNPKSLKHTTRQMSLRVATLIRKTQTNMTFSHKMTSTGVKIWPIWNKVFIKPIQLWSRNLIWLMKMFRKPLRNHPRHIEYHRARTWNQSYFSVIARTQVKPWDALAKYPHLSSVLIGTVSDAWTLIMPVCCEILNLVVLWGN